MPYFELEQLPQTFRAVFFHDDLLTKVDGVVHEAPLYVGQEMVFETAYVISRVDAGEFKEEWQSTQVHPDLARSLYLDQQNLFCLYSLATDQFHPVNVADWRSREEVDTAVLGWQHLAPIVRLITLTAEHSNLVLEMKTDNCRNLPD